MTEIKEIKPAETIESMAMQIVQILDHQSSLVSFQALKRAELEIMSHWLDKIIQDNY